MKSSSEIRAEAWTICRTRGCVWAFFVVWTVLSMFVGLVREFWSQAVASMGIQTWGVFLPAKFSAMMSGMDLTVPSRAMAIQMAVASAFEVFVSCIVIGICAFGLSGFFLRSARGDMARWFGRSLGGFALPLDVAWLHLHVTIRAVAAFAATFLAFAVGGQFAGGTVRTAVLLAGLAVSLVAVLFVFYRYCQCWYLKVDNPGWTALQCLRESGRMMKGNLWRRFCLDCSYWKPALLWLIGMLVAAIVEDAPVAPQVAGFVKFALGVACSIGFFVLAAYVGIGQALFYRDLKKGVEVKS